MKHRLKTEGGQEAWILSVHPSNLEATIAEQLILAAYGIPTTTWSESAASRRTLGSGPINVREPTADSRMPRRRLLTRTRSSSASVAMPAGLPVMASLSWSWLPSGLPMTTALSELRT